MKLQNLWNWVLFASLALHPAFGAEQEQSKLDLKLRYRYEFVDQDGFAKNANASTLRTRLTYRSTDFSNFGFLVEFDDVRPVGSDLYNSSRNGISNRPVVADPEGFEVNQALILYRGIANTVVQAGRQRIMLDNHRFIGDVGWRQNDQTYDSLSLINKSLPRTTIEYAYIDGVNRIFGPDSGTPPADFQSDSHILNVKHAWLPNWNITAYAYLIDLKDSPLSSNKTIGLRMSGNIAVNEKTASSYTMEYAQQKNYGGNPNSYAADYFLLEGALTIAGTTGKLGFEVLQGDSVQAFQTPLATLHAFQGWTDKFLATPGDGIEDVYASIATKIRGASISLVHHRFRAEAGGPEYGSEWDLMVKKPFAKRYAFVIKYANYDARNFATDTEKFWIMITADLDKS